MIIFIARRFQRAIARPNPSTGVQKRHNKALVLKDEPNKGIAQNDYVLHFSMSSFRAFVLKGELR